MPLVKITRNRQVSIPKELFDQLELNEGDYLQVEREGDRIVFRPQEITGRERAQSKQELFELIDRIKERNEDVDPELVEKEVSKALQEVREEKADYGDAEK